MLAVDIGNTFTRIAAFSGSSITARVSFNTLNLTIDDLTRALGELADAADETDLWVASVMPPADPLVDAAATRAGIAKRFIRPASDDIMPHALTTPWSTGVDRLLSAYAAGVLHFPDANGGRGYVVVQCGSAATVDLVDGKGVFRGGYIIPGPKFWLMGLSAGAQLPDLSSELPDWSAVSVGNNTQDAMLHGMQAALPEAVAATALRIVPGGRGECDGEREIPVVVTGGWGEAAGKRLRAGYVHSPDLLLHGVRLFAHRHVGLL